ncbi:pseudouridine synthase [Zopfochytrium polystomum]|nr:pseudouridine synthase [Zopfochytrium polystomum]
MQISADGEQVEAIDDAAKKRKLEEPESKPAAEIPPEPKYPKKKCAILFGYCGTGYQGLQINANCRSIEAELFKAFETTGAVSSENIVDPYKFDFTRCARTDKGVHAAGQLVALKLRQVPDLKEKLNNALPEQIRIFDIVQVTNGFHAKNQCDSRLYEYLLPTYVLAEAPSHLYPHSARGNLAGDSALDRQGDTANQECGTEEQDKSTTPGPMPFSAEQRSAFRISQESLDHLRSCLKQYVGTYNYHNYTVNCPFKEAAAKRFIRSFECSSPFVREEIEWVTLTVHGQAFMLHQIRKMVGMAILLVRTKTPDSVILQSYQATKLTIPKAPALGLLLRWPVFEAYNRKFGNGRQRVDFKLIENEVQPFVEKWIHSRMIEEESSTHVFFDWLQLVDRNASQFSWFLNADGSICEDRRPVRSGTDLQREDENGEI